MTYEIRDLSGLETSVSELSNLNQKVAQNTASLRYIINEIRANWQNDAGNDIQAILVELESCAKTIEEAIVPTNDKYVSTMNTLIAETRSAQSQSM